jgi:exosortase E/protease (VPEID-CTERM system)
LPCVRWIGLFVLLIAEFLGLSWWFDTGAIGDTSWWEVFIGQTPWLMHMGVCIGAATLLVSGRPLWETLGDGYHEAPFRWSLLFLHLCCFGLLTALTSIVLERDLAASAFAGIWVSIWLAAGILNLVTWGLAALPARMWLNLVKIGWPGLLAGAAAGVIVFLFGLLTAEFWKPLGEGTLWVVYHLIDLTIGHAIVDAENFIVGTSSFSVSIAPECSGFEGMGLIGAFCGIYLWLYRGSLRFPRALLLIPLGVATIWIFNALRIAFLIGLGSHGFERIALGGFHSQAGWLAFNAVALGLVLLSDRLGFVSADLKSADSDTSADAQVAPENLNPARAFLAPFLTSVAAAMIAAAFTADFEWLYPLRVVAVFGVLWAFRHSYAKLGWTCSWQAFALGGLTFLLWAVFSPANPGAEFQRGTEWSVLPAGWALAWVVIRILGYVVAVPLAEELAFRGYLTRRLQAPSFTDVPLGQFSWLSFVGSSVLFGALHGQNWLPGILAGMLFALALYRKGRMGDAVVAHATANGLIAVCGLAGLTFLP